MVSSFKEQRDRCSLRGRKKERGDCVLLLLFLDLRFEYGSFGGGFIGNVKRTWTVRIMSSMDGDESKDLQATKSSFRFHI